jgi:hypothetical protein
VAVVESSRPSGTVIWTRPCRRHSESSKLSPVALASSASTRMSPCVIFTRLNSSVLFL